jgi:RNA polymerase sigma-70 factor (ECF subfamily)
VEQTSGAALGSEANDAALISRVVAGDDSALAMLYDRYAGVVYSTARRILDDVGAAEEILQDIFYHFWRTASSFDPARGSLAGWLLVSARNRAIDRLRRRDRTATEGLGEGQVALPFHLESQISQNEMISKVRSVLATLAPPQREALELAYFQGMTHSEIARRTGEPLGTVKTRLRAALGELKRALNP